MVFSPNCKINLGLRILRKRPDGYHDLETVFYPLALRDVLEIIPAGSAGTPDIQYSGLPIPGDPTTNLCLRAWQLLKKDFLEMPPVGAWLHKNIPMGSGLGGGSSDGAAMLQLLDNCCHLGLGKERLLKYAALLGSDCPFFILNKPCLGRSRGEELEPLELDLSGYSFVLIHPGIPVSTARAFSQVSPGVPAKPLATIIRQPIGTWASELVNDFEVPFLSQHPEMARIKDKLYTEGALYASLTGSGSSFFGIFEKKKVPSLSFEQHFRVSILE
ncbi:MAG TPA: 4-(cytidine 5'-diphospho)-2-C-methyl-D-erythritol kinase [Puia sp.]|nr:4-(cytidine 5'-diphospho)-2-C-methyl-D-erythritol kinase [Puia sp.]